MLVSLFTLAAALASPAAAAAIGGAVAPRAEISDYSGTPIAFTWPPPRAGWNAANATLAPCGGQPLGNRTRYPITGGDISLTQSGTVENVAVLYTNDPDPSRFHAFSSYGGSFEEIGRGNVCTKGPDFSSLGFSEGDVATLMLFYQLDDATSRSPYYYQCADLELVAATGFVASQSYTCSNSTDTLTVASGNDTIELKGWSEGAGPTATGSDSAHAATASAPAASASAQAASSGAIANTVAVVLPAVAAAAAFLSF